MESHHLEGEGKGWEMGSLVPRPPPFLPSVCIYNNTQKRKTTTTKNGEGLGEFNTHI